MTSQNAAMSRGQTWFDALTRGAATMPGLPPSLRVADAPLGGALARFLAVLPHSSARFPRARDGEVGLEEGWSLAAAVREASRADEGGTRRPIVAIVDVRSQAYGQREELLGIHLAAAAAVDAYASARLAGHPIVALLVGRAMSGAFLAHGYQANRILALDDPGVVVHAMGKEAAARVTRRSVSELDALGDKVLPMAYDIRAFARLGVLDGIITGVHADSPSAGDVARVRAELVAAVADARRGPTGLQRRLASEAARLTRAASLEARRRLTEQWDAV